MADALPVECQKRVISPHDTFSDGLQLDNRNGYPSHIQFNVDTSYDSQTYDPQFEHEMNRRNASKSYFHHPFCPFFPHFAHLTSCFGHT